jgi:hypothetical protein
VINYKLAPMPRITINAYDVLRTLREVADERPDYVYTTPANEPSVASMCYYVHTDDEGHRVPGCLIGTVLNRLGVPLDKLRQFEGWGARELLTNIVVIVGPNADIASEILVRAQRYQDGSNMIIPKRRTWGDVVSYAFSDFGVAVADY